MIKMKTDEAMRKGLLDPILAKELGIEAVGSPNENEIKPKKKRAASKPAELLVAPGEIPGSGDLVLDPQGQIQRAMLDLKIMPVPKERPRVVRHPKTGQVMSFTPRRTEAFHAQVHSVLDHIRGSKPLMSGPLRVDMSFKMPVPKSWPKWKKEDALAGIVRPTGRPDMDNLEKAFLDALNGKLIEDDSLVVERYARKIYAEEPGIEAKVDRLIAGHVNINRRQADLIRKIFGLCEE